MNAKRCSVSVCAWFRVSRKALCRQERPAWNSESRANWKTGSFVFGHNIKGLICRSCAGWSAEHAQADLQSMRTGFCLQGDTWTAPLSVCKLLIIILAWQRFTVQGSPRIKLQSLSGKGAISFAPSLRLSTHTRRWQSCFNVCRRVLNSFSSWKWDKGGKLYGECVGVLYDSMGSVCVRRREFWVCMRIAVVCISATKLEPPAAC